MFEHETIIPRRLVSRSLSLSPLIRNLHNSQRDLISAVLPFVARRKFCRQYPPRFLARIVVPAIGAVLGGTTQLSIPRYLEFQYKQRRKLFASRLKYLCEREMESALGAVIQTLYSEFIIMQISPALLSRVRSTVRNSLCELFKERLQMRNEYNHKAANIKCFI